MNTFELGCAVLSASVYQEGRSPLNEIKFQPYSMSILLPRLADGHLFEIGCAACHGFDRRCSFN